MLIDTVVPKDMRTRLRMLAAARGVKMTAIVVQALSDYLDSYKEGDEIQLTRSIGTRDKARISWYCPDDLYHRARVWCVIHDASFMSLVRALVGDVLDGCADEIEAYVNGV